MGTPTATIDLKRYGRLLAKAAPRVIATESENDRARHCGDLDRVEGDLRRFDFGPDAIAQPLGGGGHGREPFPSR